MFGSVSVSRRRILRPAAFLVAPLLVVGILTAAEVSAAPSGVTATVVAPTCGTVATLTLSTTRTSRVHFELVRSSRSTTWNDIYLQGPRTTSVSITIAKTETLSVRVEGTNLATKTVSPSPVVCGGSAPKVPALAPGFSAAVNAPACGAEAPVTLNNGAGNTVWFEIWRQGRTAPDALVALAPSQVTTVTDTITAPGQVTKVLWNGQVLAQKTLSAAAPCPGTTTTTAKPTTTTAKPTTTVQPTTTTTTKPTTTTTALPTCKTADKLNPWGCPVRVDNFDGTELSGAAVGWNKYDHPTLNPPRSPKNVRVQNGELQLVGTYDRKTDTIMGSAVADHFNQMYGRWEVRARADHGAGYSAVSLLWPDSGKWPDDGELDLFEIPRTERERAMSVFHNGPTNSSLGHWTYLDATQWHTYAIEWMPTRTDFIIDGKVVFSSTSKKLIPTTSPMHITLQFDARRTSDGCTGWYQCADSSTPAETIMHVDYIKAWSKPA